MRKGLVLFLFLLSHLCWGQAPFQTQSVLRTGNWIKIGLVSDGIYDLSLSSLQSAGLSINQPDQIAVFAGNPSALPMPNKDFFVDDLQEIPTQSIFNGASSVERIRFYGKGPHAWSISTDTFYYQNNLYSDTNYYYVTVLNRPAKKISSIATLTPPSATNTEMDAFWAIDLNKKSVSRSGQQWFDDELDGTTTKEYPTNFQGLVTGAPIDLIFNIGARSYSVNPSLGLAEKNGAFLGIYPFSAIFNYTYASKMRMFDQGKRISFIPSTGNPILQVSFNKNGDPGAIGYVDYFMAKARCRVD
ncbi:MAG: type secretion system sortase PorU, partial [Bacteroidota bacterium]